MYIVGCLQGRKFSQIAELEISREIFTNQINVCTWIKNLCLTDTLKVDDFDVRIFYFAQRIHSVSTYETKLHVPK